MNKKLVQEYLIITFAIMIIFWGGCALLSQMLDLTVSNLFLRIMFFIGGFSPTIASYMSLKRSHRVTGFTDWLRKVFDMKHGFAVYGAVFLFTAIYFFFGCIINGFEMGAPLFMIIVIAPLMLFGGGNEEAGWRMVLQPELEKEFGFNIATVATALFWWIWHLPLFFIKGTSNASMNYFLFGLMCLTLSYALGTVRKISNGVFPCILLHCLLNGISGIFMFNMSLLSCIITLIVTIVISIIILFLYDKKQRFSSNF